MPAQSIQVLVAALLAATVPALAGTPPLGLLMQALPPGGWDTAWVLVQRETPGAPDPWSQDESFLRLLEDKDLAVIRVAKMKVLVNPDLWSQLGEGRSLLVSRNFKTVVDLAGAVTGDDLVAAMDEGGYKTVKERRDAFLHEHPDHGEMLDEQLRSALGILNARLRTWSGKPGQPLTEEEADRLFQGTAEALEPLLVLPDWWRLPHRAQLCQALEALRAGRSPRMRGLMEGMRDQVRELWTREPRSGGARDGALWIALERGLEQGRFGSLPAALPAPGEIWPLRFEIDLMARSAWLEGAWKDLTPFLEAMPSAMPGASAKAADWKEYADRQAHVPFLLAVAYGRQGLWKDAEVAAMACREWSGKGWKTFAAALQEALGGGFQMTPEFKSQLDLEPLPEWPLPPSRAPLRMVGNGVPAKRFDAVRTDASFLPWGPDELSWGQASLKEQGLLAGWAGHPEARSLWGTFRGDADLVAAWEEPVLPAPMATLLSAIDTPELSLLSAFIRKDPGHLDARRKRFRLIRNRMPCPALEAMLAEDAAAAGLAVDAGPGGWRPEPTLWAAPIARAMPDLESSLRRWPSATGLWKTWLSWAPLHPLQPSPHAFAQTLAVGGVRSVWLCRLPEELHRAVKRELLGSHRFLENLSWFQEAWDGLKIAVETPDGAVTPARIELLYALLREAKVAAGDRLDSTNLDKERLSLLDRLHLATAPVSPVQPSVLEQLTGFPSPARKVLASPRPSARPGLGEFP